MNTNRPRATAKVAALVLTIACLALAAWAVGMRVSRAQVEEEAAVRAAVSRAVIYGRAVNEATGRPLQRAHIKLMMLDGSRVDRDTLTDARGEFRIGNLPAGAYVVWADMSGMLSPESFMPLNIFRHESPDPEVIRRYFEVVELDGKAERELTVRARRGGAITGRVTYADGEPAVGVPFHLLDRKGQATLFSLPRMAPNGTALRTDDRGVYRVAGLPPGEYLVAVSEWADHGRAEEAGGLSPTISDMSHGRSTPQLLHTYHPSASSVKGAAVVVVGAGEERAGVDVMIPERALHTIAGIVRAARGGRPIQGAYVSISSPDDDLGSADTKTDAEGRWQLREVPDGLYKIFVSPPVEYEFRGGAGVGNANFAAMNMNVPLDANANASLPSPPRRRQRFAPLTRELRVSGDVAEFVVELGEGGRISGTVVAEGGKKLSYVVVYTVLASQTLDTSLPFGPDTRVEGGAFELEGLQPGRYFLFLKDYAEPGATYLKSITWQGKDLLREPLEIGEGTRVESVRVVFGSDPAALRMRVTRAGNRPASNVNVFLLPADLTRWSLSPAQLFCATGDDGVCFINAPPGDYLAVTVASFNKPKDLEQELRRRALNAPRVTLRPNEQKTLETVVKE